MWDAKISDDRPHGKTDESFLNTPTTNITMKKYCSLMEHHSPRMHSAQLLLCDRQGWSQLGNVLPIQQIHFSHQHIRPFLTSHRPAERPIPGEQKFHDRAGVF